MKCNYNLIYKGVPVGNGQHKVQEEYDYLSHSCVVRSLVLVSNISDVAWFWCNDRWWWLRLWLLGDLTCDVVCSMGCPRCITVWGTRPGSIWNYVVQVSKLSIDKVKLLSFQYGLFFGLGTFGCDVLCYGWEQGLKEPIQEDPIVKLDFA